MRTLPYGPYQCRGCGQHTFYGLQINQVSSIPLCSLECHQLLAGAVNLSMLKSYKPQANLTTTVLTRAEYGRAAWLVLHSVANYYPVNPSIEDRAAADAFLTGFATQLPCRMCRGHFATVLRDHPWKLQSRFAFREWVNKVHNIVNSQLGKELIPLSSGPGYFIPDTSYTPGTNLCTWLPDEREFGRAVWLMLHSMAAFYSPKDKETVQLFHRGFSHLYPSSTGGSRSVYEKELKQQRGLHAVLKTRIGYEAWVCDFHNRVNALLGKPVYMFRKIQAKLHAVYTCVEEDQPQIVREL